MNLSQDGGNKWGGLKLTENKLHSWVSRDQAKNGCFKCSFWILGKTSIDTQISLFQHWVDATGDSNTGNIWHASHLTQCKLCCVKELFVSPAHTHNHTFFRLTPKSNWSNTHLLTQSNSLVTSRFCCNRSNLMWSNWSKLLVMDFYCVCVCKQMIHLLGPSHHRTINDKTLIFHHQSVSIQ